MKITWLGHSCFKIQVKNVTLVIDPYDSKIGLKNPTTKADIVLVTHDHYDHNNISAISGNTGNPYIIKNPGDYEIQEVMIQGFEAPHDAKLGAERGMTNIYSIQSEGISVLHLGDLGDKLSNELIEKIGNVDILMIPVGGTYTLDAKTAMEIVTTIEPRIVIPMHYKIPGLNIDIDPVEPFLKEMGVVKPTTHDVYKISKRELPQEETELVLLEPAKAK